MLAAEVGLSDARHAERYNTRMASRDLLLRVYHGPGVAVLVC
jgi:hypothetical protein